MRKSLFTNWTQRNGAAAAKGRPTFTMMSGKAPRVLSVARWQNVISSFPWIAPGWRAWERNPRKGRDQILQHSVAEPESFKPGGPNACNLKIWLWPSCNHAWAAPSGCENEHFPLSIVLVLSLRGSFATLMNITSMCDETYLKCSQMSPVHLNINHQVSYIKSNLPDLGLSAPNSFQQAVH